MFKVRCGVGKSQMRIKGGVVGLRAHMGCSLNS